MDFIEKVQRPSNKTIRLAKELAKQHAPMMLDHNDTVRSIMNRSDISDTKIEKVKSFKKILFRTIIIDVKPMQDRYIIKTKKVRIR
ncbi:MAG TPA: hypothetical protein VJ907_08855 [Halanaerobiales bacterium]|nr:hypothetical protein [Halanaerobiales bacterium]